MTTVLGAKLCGEEGCTFEWERWRVAYYILQPITFWVWGIPTCTGFELPVKIPLWWPNSYYCKDHGDKFKAQIAEYHPGSTLIFPLKKKWI